MSNLPRRPSKSAPAKPRVYAGVDHAARLSERRERFIQAGIQLFGTAGYHATTVRTLCEESGLTSRYFYESFASTESLLITCYQRLMSDFRARLLASLDAAPREIPAMVRVGVHAFLESMRDPIVARISLVEVLGVSPAVRAAAMENTRIDGNQLVMLLKSTGVKTGLSAQDEETIGVALAGSMAFVANHWIESGYKAPIEDMVENCLRVLGGTAMALGAPQGLGKGR